MKIKELILKYREVMAYLFFGGCTTLVNIISYYFTYNILNISNVNSTVIAWIISVLFAYVTNRIFVFGSSSKGKAAIKEITSFFSCRILTGVMDVAIMYLAVDIFRFDSLLWKVISNIAVIIANYIFSKIFVFKNK